MLFGDFPDGDAVGKAPKLDAVFEYREAIRLAVACVKSDLEHDAALDERCNLVDGAVGKWGYGKLTGVQPHYKGRFASVRDCNVPAFVGNFNAAWQLCICWSRTA